MQSSCLDMSVNPCSVTAIRQFGSQESTLLQFLVGLSNKSVDEISRVRGAHHRAFEAMASDPYFGVKLGIVIRRGACDYMRAWKTGEANQTNTCIDFMRLWWLDYQNAQGTFL